MPKSKLLYSQNTKFLEGEISLPVNIIELYNYITANTKPQNIRECSFVLLTIGISSFSFGCWMTVRTVEYIISDIPQILMTDNSVSSILWMFGTATGYIFTSILMLYMLRVSWQTSNERIRIKNAEALLDNYDIFYGRIIEVVSSSKYRTRIHYEFDIDGQIIDDWFRTSSKTPLNIGDSVTIISDRQFHVLI
ncbi:MAG: hypothetical protein AAFV98_00350 [Chloroflexota bacterium]